MPAGSRGAIRFGQAQVTELLTAATITVSASRHFTRCSSRPSAPVVRGGYRPPLTSPAAARGDMTLHRPAGQADSIAGAARTGRLRLTPVVAADVLRGRTARSEALGWSSPATPGILRVVGRTHKVAGRRHAAAAKISASPPADPLIPAGVSAVVALAAAGLALIGLTGGVLVRAVRSSPGTIVMAIAALIVLAVVAERTRGGRRLIAATAMLCVVLLTLGLGATSIDERDKPSVALKASSTSSSATSPGKWTVTVRATASGLRAREDMLVQLQGLANGIPTDSSEFDVTHPKCNTTVLRSSESERINGPYPAPAGDLLLWTQAGPSADGSTVVESSVERSGKRLRGRMRGGHLLPLTWLRGRGLVRQDPIHAQPPHW